MMRPGFAFSTTFKVRHAEIDGQRIVFNSRYLEYADVAVGEFWDWTGIAAALGDVWAQTEFNVRRTEIDYLKPFRHGDTIEVFMRIGRVGGTSLTQQFELCHAVTGALHAKIDMVIVNVDLATGTSRPIGDEVRGFLAALPSG